jgi:hypothetical protein
VFHLHRVRSPVGLLMWQVTPGQSPSLSLCEPPATGVQYHQCDDVLIALPHVALATLRPLRPAISLRALATSSIPCPDHPTLLTLSHDALLPPTCSIQSISTNSCMSPRPRHNLHLRPPKPNAARMPQRPLWMCDPSCLTSRSRRSMRPSSFSTQTRTARSTTTVPRAQSRHELARL